MAGGVEKVFEEDETEEMINVCTTCLRRSHTFHEFKATGATNFMGKLFQRSAIVHVCVLCKMALDFVSKFERLCQISRDAVEKYDAIEIQSDCYSEDPKVEEALNSLCDWVEGVLDENLRVYELDGGNIAIQLEEEEEVEEGRLPVVKTEQLLEEYLGESEEYEIDSTGQEAIILEPEEETRVIKQEKEDFECEMCQRKFMSRRAVTTHVTRHHLKVPQKETKPEIYACTETACDFQATSQLKLNRHLQRTHNLVVKKRFCCDVCGHVYPTKCRLQYHMNCHLNISPFHCDFEGCTRTFRNPTRLRNHKQEFHLQIIRMHCAICGKGFHTKASHDIHILGHDKPTIPCEVCGRLLTNRKTLRTHLMTHTGERRYKCEVPGCHKAFTKCSGLQVHMRSHTKERPYKCPHCTLSFTYKVSMKKHMLKYHGVPWETSTLVKPETQRVVKEEHVTIVVNAVEINAT